MDEGDVDVRVPLTPAEQMLRIRRAVSGDDDDQAAGVEQLAAFLQNADRIQERLRDLEGRAWVRETEFQSHAPVIARLIVAVRNLWNWMSTKWYVLPMLQQQNGFNVAAAQMIRELWTLNRSQLAALSLLQQRVEALENQVAQLQGIRPADES